MGHFYSLFEWRSKYCAKLQLADTSLEPLFICRFLSLLGERIQLLVLQFSMVWICWLHLHGVCVCVCFPHVSPSPVWSARWSLDLLAWSASGMALFAWLFVCNDLLWEVGCPSLRRYIMPTCLSPPTKLFLFFCFFCFVNRHWWSLLLFD